MALNPATKTILVEALCLVTIVCAVLLIYASRLHSQITHRHGKDPEDTFNPNKE